MGIAGAPKVGDAAAWEARIAQGEQTLLDHAINGYQGSAGYMPAKGGFAFLSDEDVAAAVAYMVAESQ
jgi:cytochrome c5